VLILRAMWNLGFDSCLVELNGCVGLDEDLVSWQLRSRQDGPESVI
jgi:hypothetical protein